MPMMPMSDGTALHYRFDGDASRPVLMLSNSLGSTLDMWDLQMPALVEHFRVLRYDNRGHGASDVPIGPYTVERIGRDGQDDLRRDAEGRRQELIAVVVGGRELVAVLKLDRELAQVVASHDHPLLG